MKHLFQVQSKRVGLGVRLGQGLGQGVDKMSATMIFSNRLIFVQVKSWTHGKHKLYDLQTALVLV